MLNGVFDPPPDTDPYVKMLLEGLQMPRQIRDSGRSNACLPTPVYRAYWKTANSSISCHPGALSFASLKAGSIGDTVTAFECVMTRIPLLSGYSPLCWHQMLDVMILKYTGLTNLSNLWNNMAAGKIAGPSLLQLIRSLPMT
jgi:hypothetical protein